MTRAAFLSVSLSLCWPSLPAAAAEAATQEFPLIMLIPLPPACTARPPPASSHPLIPQIISAEARTIQTSPAHCHALLLTLFVLLSSFSLVLCCASCLSVCPVCPVLPASLPSLLLLLCCATTHTSTTPYPIHPLTLIIIPCLHGCQLNDSAASKSFAAFSLCFCITLGVSHCV